jgi:hypothetical protein
MASPQRAVLVEQVRLIYGVLGRSSWSTLALSLFVAWVLRQLGMPIAIWLATQTLLKLGEQIEIRWFIRDEAIAAHRANGAAADGDPVSPRRGMGCAAVDCRGRGPATTSSYSWSWRSVEC